MKQLRYIILLFSIVLCVPEVSQYKRSFSDSLFKVGIKHYQKFKSVSFLLLFCSLICSSNCFAQIIVNPVFDRIDTPEFRIVKVELTPDTTIVHCQFQAEKGSIANVSKETCLENIKDGSKYRIIRVEGLPFGPQEKIYSDSSVVNVVLYFPYFPTDKFNLIESDSVRAFNIYGINCKESYNNCYTDNDINVYRKEAVEKENDDNWTLAVGYSLKQLDASNYVYGVRSEVSSWAMFNLLMEYMHIEQYEKAIDWGHKAIEILSVLASDSVNYDVLARTYGTVATAYYMVGDREKYMQYKEKSLNVRRVKEGIGRIGYVEYLRELSEDYYYDGNYPKALLYGREVVDIYCSKYKENNKKYAFDYIVSLSNLCSYYHALDKNVESIECGRLALNLYETGICDNVVWLKYLIKKNLALTLANVGLIDEAIGHLNEIIVDIQKRKLKKDRLFFSSKMDLLLLLLNSKQDSINIIKEYELLIKEYEDSINRVGINYPVYNAMLFNAYKLFHGRDSNKSSYYLKKTINAQKAWTGEESISYGELLFRHACEIVEQDSLNFIKTRDSIAVYLGKSLGIIKRHLNNSAFNMSKNERNVYWNRYKSAFTVLLPIISRSINSDEVNSIAYDAALFHKGWLLSSEKEVFDIVNSSKDSTMIRLFAEYVKNMSLLEKQYEYNPDKFVIDSLYSIIQDEDYILSQSITRFNKQYKGTNVSWREVKKQLRDSDVAIEFVSYPYKATIYYDAYVINSKSESPQLVSLCDEKSLRKCIDSDTIDYKGLSDLIWGDERLREAIESFQNIYFSTSGLFNIIGIEYLPYNSYQNINERFNLFRLSSTRELCFKDVNPVFENSCLFGGLDYNHQSEGIYVPTSSLPLPRAIVDTLIDRGGFDPLLGSKEEVKKLKSEMIRNHIDCKVYMDSDGTEVAFKNLSGSNVNIIHISTHGLYVPYSKDSIAKRNNYKFILSDEVSTIDEVDKALSRSFLVMSGGNMIIIRDSDLKGQEDGILTALEISHLDFTNLELVVLAACQTALGVNDSEGVYGLQRGFKKAGAKTILMSLDKVDDEATTLLMVEFYKNLLAGKSKHQSLKDAQHYLRQVENGKYDDHKYWASFIMLDGLN